MGTEENYKEEQPIIILPMHRNSDRIYRTDIYDMVIARDDTGRKIILLRDKPEIKKERIKITNPKKDGTEGNTGTIKKTG